MLYITDGAKVKTTSILNGPASTESLHTTDWIMQKPASVEDVTNELVTFTYQLPRKTDQIQGILYGFIALLFLNKMSRYYHNSGVFSVGIGMTNLDISLQLQDICLKLGTYFDY